MDPVDPTEYGAGLARTGRDRRNEMLPENVEKWCDRGHTDVPQRHLGLGANAMWPAGLVQSARCGNAGSQYRR